MMKISLSLLPMNDSLKPWRLWCCSRSRISRSSIFWCSWCATWLLAQEQDHLWKNILIFALWSFSAALACHNLLKDTTLRTLQKWHWIFPRTLKDYQKIKLSIFSQFWWGVWILSHQTQRQRMIYRLRSLKESRTCLKTVIAYLLCLVWSSITNKDRNNW